MPGQVRGLILERLGKFWGAFSVIDLFILNAPTIVTEFIGISLAAGHLRVPKIAAALAAVLGLKHSLHRGVKQAKGFYAVYAALIASAATIVLIPGSPLGLLTPGVQVLIGYCATRRDGVPAAVQRQGRPGAVGQSPRRPTSSPPPSWRSLITLSIVLTAAVIFPSITARQIFEIMTSCAVGSALTGGYLLPRTRGGHAGSVGDSLPAAI